MTHPVSAQPRTEPDDGPDPRRWKALTVCLVAGFMTLLDVSIVNVALPSIEKGLGASPSDLQWVVSGYALTFGLVLVPSGRLGDATGRRRMFVAGVVVFGVASLLCGLATTSSLLVAARLLQGIGGGLLNPQVSGLIQALFHGRERAKAFGLLGATIGISTAVGPIAGGVILSLLGADAGWRWIFVVNLPVAFAAVVLALRWIPAHVHAEDESSEPARGGDRAPTPARRRTDLDPVGVALLGAGVLALLLPLVESGRGGGSATVPGWVAAVGAGLLGVFVLWEHRYAARGRTPLVDLGLFSLPGYASGAVVATVYFSGFTGIFFVLTVYLQQALGYSPLLAGLAVTPFAGGSAVMSAVGGRLVTRFGRSLVTAGLVVVVVGLVATDLVLSSVDGPATGWYAAVPLLVAGLGSGMVISPNITLTLSEVPVRRAGTAGGVLQTGQRIGTAAGIALVGTVFFAHLRDQPGDAAAVSLRVATGLVVLALLASLADVWLRRRHRAEAAA
ncbi:MFS transporter [Phycicoccus sp. Soil748]|uniref:MFS transporter n=1 Tax=Phycicoccus sp. Soil748 TaxID=1736397 RepID=UPI0007032947|nr:MFS transporter [Phycicoccus sp. Soil748]KRE52690.1 MFS transporter [Phycicoccus sp. Soil748]